MLVVVQFLGHLNQLRCAVLPWSEGDCLHRGPRLIQLLEKEMLLPLLLGALLDQDSVVILLNFSKRSLEGASLPCLVMQLIFDIGQSVVDLYGGLAHGNHPVEIAPQKVARLVNPDRVDP